MSGFSAGFSLHPLHTTLCQLHLITQTFKMHLKRLISSRMIITSFAWTHASTLFGAPRVIKLLALHETANASRLMSRASGSTQKNCRLVSSQIIWFASVTSLSRSNVKTIYSMGKGKYIILDSYGESIRTRSSQLWSIGIACFAVIIAAFTVPALIGIDITNINSNPTQQNNGTPHRTSR